MKCDLHCIGCYYHCISLNSCDYIFAVGKPRGCEAGSKCTKKLKTRTAPLFLQKEKDTELRPASYKDNKEDTEFYKRLRLYKLGWSDSQIANACRCSKKVIYGWRKRNNLLANYDSAHRQIRNFVEETK